MPSPVQVAFKPINKPYVGKNNYQGFKPGETQLFKAGERPYGGKVLESDILLEHDVEVTVRDGCRLYFDVYRPPGAGSSSEKVPAILAWSPYGKKYSGVAMLPMCTWCCGVDITKDISGLEKFEGPDPARWVPRGFALVSVDARGAGNSDGFVGVMGSQEAEDGYDVIEAIAKMYWCNGSVGLAGNSYLAIIQWFIAALQPPSLKAIAPWEGCGDLYREQFVRGGVFDISNFDLIAREIIHGNHGVEDFSEMYRRSKGLMNKYWEDKRPNMKNINVPAYITGSDVSSIHTMGSLRGYMELNTPNKWLRWSAYQEWYDLWSVPETNQELMDFFARYLKGIENGWEKTPRVRISLLRFGDRDAISNIEEEDFPIPRTAYRELFMNVDGGLTESPCQQEGSVTYDSEDPSVFASFTHAFKSHTRLMGIPKAYLYMSCKDLDDIIVYILLRKLDVNGKVLDSLNYPFEATPIKSIAELGPRDRNSTTLHLGSQGILRASHRKIDRSKTTHPQIPFHPHDQEEKIPPGTIVELEVGIWAMGWDLDAGESIRVQIMGQAPGFKEFQAKAPRRPEEEKNKGIHELHFGGKYQSRVILPFI